MGDLDVKIDIDNYNSKVVFVIQGAFAMYHEEIEDLVKKFVKDDLGSTNENYPINEEEE